MRKIGIIGATGMLGHNIAVELAKDATNEIVVIHRASSDLSRISDLKLATRVGDLNDQNSLVEAFSGLDYVFHCAAYYPTVPKPKAEELKVSSQQMEHFINAIKISGVKKALYLGGAIAIPKSTNGPANEEAFYTGNPPNMSAYSLVKCKMDEMAREAGKNGIPIVIGIPPMTFGKYDYGPTTGKLVVNVVNRTLPGFIDGKRNVIYAGDAARGLILACFKGNIGERYLITGVNISVKEIIQEVNRQEGIDTLPRQISLGTANVLAKIFKWKYRLLGGSLPVLDDTAIAVLSAGQFLDGRKAKEELGYEPEVNLKEMLEITIKWFKENNYISQS